MSGKTTLIRFAAALVVAATVGSGASTASAAIDSVASSDQPFTINTDIPLVANSNPNDTTLRLWDEKQDTVLSSELTVHGIAGVDPVTLAAGTIVSSHMLQWDGIKGTDDVSVFAEIVFSSDILAVIGGTKKLLQSDYLGLDGVEYVNFKNRGVEKADFYQVLGDRVRLQIGLNGPDPGDWLRIITAQNPVVVPEPEDTPEVPDDQSPPPIVAEEVPAPAALPAGLAMIMAMATRRRRAANRR